MKILISFYCLLVNFSLSSSLDMSDSDDDYEDVGSLEATNETKRGASTHKLVCRHTVTTHQLRCVGTQRVLKCNI